MGNENENKDTFKGRSKPHPTKFGKNVKIMICLRISRITLPTEFESEIEDTVSYPKI